MILFHIVLDLSPWLFSSKGWIGRSSDKKWLRQVVSGGTSLQAPLCWLSFYQQLAVLWRLQVISPHSALFVFASQSSATLSALNNGTLNHVRRFLGTEGQAFLDQYTCCIKWIWPTIWTSLFIMHMVVDDVELGLGEEADIVSTCATCGIPGFFQNPYPGILKNWFPRFFGISRNP